MWKKTATLALAAFTLVYILSLGLFIWSNSSEVKNGFDKKDLIGKKKKFENPFALKKKNPRYPDESDVYTETCRESLGVGARFDQRVPVIYFVTPTYPRREQLAELTRLSQTLVNVKNLIWIIAEDARNKRNCSSSVVNTVWLIETEVISFVHLISPMPEMYKSEYRKPRGVSGRNAAVKWILDQEDNLLPGVLYFGDDDNTYDLRLFEEIRLTRQVSMLPVGFIGTTGFSSPIVVQGKVVGFSDSWFEYRKFPVDMAGFAVNIELLIKHKPKMPYLGGHEETLFLENLHVNMSEIEPLANNCTKILVWHTKTLKGDWTILREGTRSGTNRTNIDTLIKDMSKKGLLAESSTGKVVPMCWKTSGCKT